MKKHEPTLQLALEWSQALRRKFNLEPNFSKWLFEQYKTNITQTQLTEWAKELGIIQLIANKMYHTRCLEQLKLALRLLRDRVFYIQYLRETTGLSKPAETGRIVSDLAHYCVQFTYQFLYDKLSATHGHPICPTTGQPLDMLLVAMGKWGGYELNVSSDLDFIVLYEHEGQTQGARSLSYHEFFTRLTQQLSSVLSQPTAQGIVFRTDLRLRPDGNTGPLVWNLDGLHKYFIQQGREWERYAWIKARLVTLRTNSPSQQAKQKFEQICQPFVYRKYFDFGTLEPLRQLREQIRNDWHRTVHTRAALDESLNIKIGEGSIREVEFIVQLNQLIRGGQSPSLQTQNLHKAIEAQENAQLISHVLAEQLRLAYNFLRQIEHLLQFKDDTQTHLLPAQPKQFELLGALLGLSAKEFEQQLTVHRALISRTFRNAFRIAGMPKNKALTQRPNKSNTEYAAIKNTTHKNDAIQTYWKKLKNQFFLSQKAQRLTTYNKKRLEELADNIEMALVKDVLPLRTIPRIWHLIDKIALRSAYISLLLEYPATLTRLNKILAASPWAAHYLTQYPLVLNRLIYWEQLMQPIDFQTINQQLYSDLQACRLANQDFDIEKQMNLMRDVQHQIIFQLLAQDLEGNFSVESLADQLSALADYMLKHTLNCTWQLIKNNQKNLPKQPHFAVIAYGKLGAKELGYASDLDLVFLYDEKNKHATRHYVRLARRMISWLSALTSSGRLYEVDMRLRPDGNAGLIAISFDSFANYQKRKAWMWEHQALTRARFVTGNAQLGARFEKLRLQILCQPRDKHHLKNEIIKMRQKIAKAHPNTTDLFDIKHDHGGMVDVEFITQFLVLAYSARHAALKKNLGNTALLKKAAKYHLIPKELALPTIESYRFYRRKQHQLRLQDKPFARIPTQKTRPYQQAVLDLWRHIFEN